MTIGSPPFIAASFGTVSRFIGAGTGWARLVDVSSVWVTDMGLFLATRGRVGKILTPTTPGQSPPVVSFPRVPIRSTAAIYSQFGSLICMITTAFGLRVSVSHEQGGST